MFQDEDEQPITRARYLMSPYNLREARRQRQFRHAIIIYGSLYSIVFGCLFTLWYFWG